MAQARESSPVIDRRSNHCATPPTIHFGMIKGTSLGRRARFVKKRESTSTRISQLKTGIFVLIGYNFVTR